MSFDNRENLDDIIDFDVAKNVANKIDTLVLSTWFDTSVCDEIKNEICNVANLIENENVFVKVSLKFCKKSIFESKFDWFSYYL